MPQNNRETNYSPGSLFPHYLKKAPWNPNFASWCCKWDVQKCDTDKQHWIL